MVLGGWRSAKLGGLLVWAAISAVMLPAISHAEIVDNPASEASGDAEFVTAERLVKAQQFKEALPPPAACGQARPWQRGCLQLSRVQPAQSWPA
jgi:hypothetical protein